MNCENSKLSSIIYKYAYLQHTQNGLEMPWIKAVKNILDSCGFSNIWENQGNFNSKWLSLSLKQKLFDQFQQKWRSDMNNSSKGLCYKIITLARQINRERNNNFFRNKNNAGQANTPVLKQPLFLLRTMQNRFIVCP